MAEAGVRPHLNDLYFANFGKGSALCDLRQVVLEEGLGNLFPVNVEPVLFAVSLLGFCVFLNKAEKLALVRILELPDEFFVIELAAGRVLVHI